MQKLGLLLGVWLLTRRAAAQTVCEHEQGPFVEIPDAANNNVTVLQDGRSVTHDLNLNKARLYYYENLNVTTMNQPDRYRNLIVSLEPCDGVVYLFVRRTRRCWPDPQSCCRPLANASGAGNSTRSAPPCDPVAHRIRCDWTHFHSVIDGSRDAAPTFFEVPLSSSKYYITVFAPSEPNLQHGVTVARFRLLALADIGAFPRPGLQGQIRSKRTGDTSVELSWDEASFVPAGISSLRYYHIYSSLLLPHEKSENSAVFLNPGKVMNTVCGLERNAVKYGTRLTSAVCKNGVCGATISGIVPRRRYVLNVVAESHRAHNSTYAGIILSTNWDESTQLLPENVVALLGAICGTVFGVAVIGYLWIVKLYD